MDKGVYKSTGFNDLLYTSFRDYLVEPNTPLYKKLYVLNGDLHFRYDAITDINLTGATGLTWLRDAGLTTLYPYNTGDNVNIGTGTFFCDGGFVDTDVTSPLALGDPINTALTGFADIQQVSFDLIPTSGEFNLQYGAFLTPTFVFTPVQEIVFIDGIGNPVVPGGGTYTLSYNGTPMVAFNWNATYNTVQSELVLLPGLGLVVVSGDPTLLQPFTVRFTGVTPPAFTIAVDDDSTLVDAFANPIFVSITPLADLAPTAMDIQTGLRSITGLNNVIVAGDITLGVPFTIKFINVTPPTTLLTYTINTLLDVGSSPVSITTVYENKSIVGALNELRGSTIAIGNAGRLGLYPSGGSGIDDVYLQNAFDISVQIESQPARASNIEYRIPNPGNAITNVDFLLSEGNQTINGDKTFEGIIDVGLSHFARYLNITSVTGLGGTITVVCSVAHGLTTNDVIVMAGWGAGYDGTYAITTAGLYNFTYAAAGVGSPTGGTAQYVVGIDTILTDAVLAKHKLEDIVIENISANPVTINIGTTPGGSEISLGLVCPVGITYVQVNEVYSATITQSLYIASLVWGTEYVDIHLHQTKIMR